MKKRWNRGITLVETIVACGVITTLMLGTIPPSVKMLQQKLTETTAQEIIAIQEAEKNYWIDKLNTNGVGQWASSIAILKNEGYLPSEWEEKNLWKNDYKVITTTSTCEVQTTIPKGLEGVIQTRCPQVNVSPSGANSIVSSTIPIPGQEPTMESVLHRTGDTRFRTAEEPVGSKKYLVAGTDLTEVESEIAKEKAEGKTERQDIYSKDLKTKGVSRTGWLSDAKFPAKIDLEKTVTMEQERIIVLLPPPFTGFSKETKTISFSFPAGVNVLKKNFTTAGGSTFSDFDIKTSLSSIIYSLTCESIPLIGTTTGADPVSIYFKWQISSGTIYTLTWHRLSETRGKIVFSDNIEIWDIPDNPEWGLLDPYTFAYSGTIFPIRIRIRFN